MAINPLSSTITPTAPFTPPADLGVSAGSSSGSGSFGQGSVLPNVTTTSQQATSAPSFYTDYLNQIAQQGKTAAQGAQYVGAQPLQQQAFNQVAQNVGNYQPALTSAINLANSVGDSGLVKAVGDVGEANLRRNIAPQTTAGIVGAGQFGSSRGASALGDVISNAELGITQEQAKAMQQDIQNRLLASQQLGTLSGQTQALGLGDVKALSDAGAQQQTILQNEQLFPMQQLMNESTLLRGYSIPTSVSSATTGPGQQGQFANSPLQNVATISAILAGLNQSPTGGGKSPLDNFLTTGKALYGDIKDLFGSSSTTPTGQVSLDSVTPIINPQGGGLLTPRGDGTYTTDTGQIVNSDGNPPY